MSNFRNLALWIIIALLLVALFNLFQSPNQGNGREEVAYSVFSQRLDEGGVIDVTIRGNRIEGTFVGNSRFSTLAPEEPVNDVTLAPRLSQHRVQINIEDADGDMSPLLSILINWFPMLLLLAVWIFFIRQMQSGSGRAMGFGKSKAKMLTERSGRVTFDDVAGVDEAKDDLIEIVDFLRDPQKFQKLGGHIPNSKGIGNQDMAGFSQAGATHERHHLLQVTTVEHGPQQDVYRHPPQLALHAQYIEADA